MEGRPCNLAIIPFFLFRGKLPGPRSFEREKKKKNSNSIKINHGTRDDHDKRDLLDADGGTEKGSSAWVRV